MQIEWLSWLLQSEIVTAVRTILLKSDVQIPNRGQRHSYITESYCSDSSLVVKRSIPYSILLSTVRYFCRRFMWSSAGLMLFILDAHNSIWVGTELVRANYWWWYTFYCNRQFAALEGMPWNMSLYYEWPNVAAWCSYDWDSDISRHANVFHWMWRVTFSQKN